jgi:spore maturation protein A
VVATRTLGLPSVSPLPLMLNYIWAGLIIISLVFALTADVRDLAQDTFRNEQPFPVVLSFPAGYNPEARRQPVDVIIDPAQYREFYGTDETPESVYTATLIRTQEGQQVRWAADARLPEPFTTIRDVTNPRDNQLQGIIIDAPTMAEPETELEPGASGPPELDAVLPEEEEIDELDPAVVPEEVPPGEVAPVEPAPQIYPATIRFEPVRFVFMNRIAQAALDFAETAAGIALGLIGVLALFLGLLKIGEEAGIIAALVRFVRPVLRPLFPTVPPDHPAFGMIALNMTANIFGLGNAATPFGIKAMEELQKLNPSEETATDPMVMLLAVNTASVQLMPPVLLIALMGLQINQLIFAITITTGISLIIAITAAKLLGRLPGYRRSDPNRIAGDDENANRATDEEPN